MPDSNDLSLSDGHHGVASCKEITAAGDNDQIYIRSKNTHTNHPSPFEKIFRKGDNKNMSLSFANSM